MIDLTNYPKFQRDIQSNQTSLIPLIIIQPNSDSPIYISINKGLFHGNTFWEDRNLKVSSLKESINLESNAFKINNFSFSLGNHEVNGMRFSDFVLEKGLMNADVDVYYKTQSCSTLEDCILIYRGEVKRFTHDDKSCKIQLEDKTEDKINQQIPKANTGYKSSIYSKDYINKPIPMLYGKVDKAPAVPFISETSGSSLSKILIVCDDTLTDIGDSPRIKLGSYFSDEATQSFFEDNSINPLYIYKDDYFQVLEYYNLDVITGNIEDWKWLEYDQYTLKDGYLEVLKKYQGLTAKNPPSDNELQCIKLRFPNDYIALPNPTADDDEWYDGNNFGVTYEQPTVKSRELAFDNPFSSESKSLQYVVTQSDYKDTFAQIPDATIEIDDVVPADNIRVQDFAAYTANVGLHNEDFSPNGNYIRSQYEIMSRLTRYAHEYNDEHDPRIQFVRLPSMSSIANRLAMQLKREYIKRINAQYNKNYTWISGINMNTWTANRINASCALSAGFMNQWAAAQGFTNMQWFYDNWDNEHSTWHQMDKYNERSFWYLHNNGSAQGKPAGQDIDYPNYFMRWDISDASVYSSTDGVTYPSPRTILGKRYASISLKNGNINNYNSYEVGYYFNLFNLNDGEPYLFGEGAGAGATLDIEYSGADDPEPALYTPLHLTYKGRHGSADKCSLQKYECAWNGSPINALDFGSNGSTYSPNVYFGHWSPWDWTNHTYQTHSHYTLPHQDLGSNSGWFLWIKKNIPSDELSAPPVSANNEFNISFNGIRIQENTLIPMTSIAKPLGNDGCYRTGTDFFGGTEINTDSEKITINKPSTTSSRRYAAIFPFKDQDISDDIHTDTYFSGKIKMLFDTSATGTTNTSANSLKVVLGAVDVNAEDSNTGVDVDWSVFDQGLDGSGATLIHQTLSDCITNSTTFYDTFDQNPEATNENANTKNFYSDLLPINDVFHQVSNYNSLAMIFRMSGGANVPTNIARFNLDINSISMLHYIIFEGAFDSPLYINCRGRINSSDEIDIDGNFKYTGQTINSQDDISEIEKPCDIIYHILEKELELTDYIDMDAIKKVRSNLILSKMAFSVNDNKKTKELIQNICKNTNMFALFKGTSLFSFASINNNYDSSDVIINTKDVIKYSFTRTPIEKIHTLVNVRYKKDYAEDEYMEETGYCDAYDFFGNKDLGYEQGYSYEYLGLDRKDKILEFQSDFIRTRGEAEALRDFILKNNCNQHNIVKLTLPLKYMNLEVGDVIQFDSLIDGVKIYGEDYTETIIRNGQPIYPYFIIDSIDKKQKNISIQATQLHDLSTQFTAQLGSITRTTGLQMPFNYTMDDYYELENFLDGYNQYFTQEQKRASDINLDGYIDGHDLTALHSLLNFNTYDGDVNADGVVNVVDIVAIVNQVLGGDADEEFLKQLDVNEDGVVDVLDVVLLVGQVLGYEE